MLTRMYRVDVEAKSGTYSSITSSFTIKAFDRASAAREALDLALVDGEDTTSVQILVTEVATHSDSN